MCRDENDRDRMVRNELLLQLDTVHLGHAHIENRAGDTVKPGRIQESSSGAERRGVEAARLE